MDRLKGLKQSVKDKDAKILGHPVSSSSSSLSFSNIGEFDNAG
jgi:hypothetical protein